MRLKRKLASSSATGTDVKNDLHEYLRGHRETLVWKLEGLGEYDIRRPMTPTGTNLLGLVKHQATTHKGHANLHASDPAERSRYRDEVEAAARLASGQ